MHVPLTPHCAQVHFVQRDAVKLFLPSPPSRAESATVLPMIKIFFDPLTVGGKSHLFPGSRLVVY